ncbi:MAG: protein-glutamate O-methyltransferase CheR [Porticoccaceae bacterium]
MQQSNNSKSLETSLVSTRAEITDSEFRNFKVWIHKTAGINLSEHKKPLVMGRLAPRMRHYGLLKYQDYFKFLTDEENPGELQIAIDLLTTNETYFFREPKHFDYLRETILKHHPSGQAMRVWSAASSSGEEAYSLGMTMSDSLGHGPWEILASDLSTRVLEKARSGHYAMSRASHIPKGYLRKYCLKGVNDQKDTFLINPELRSRIHVRQINLNEVLPEIGYFDLIVIRNVMIYFDAVTRRKVTERVVQRLKSGGYLFIGHSESLNGITDCVKPIQPSIYRKP